MVGLPFTYDAAYDDEWRTILPRLPKLRGLGAGHTHTPKRYEIDLTRPDGNDGLPVFVSPVLKSNFDLTNETLLLPGYRTYEFCSNGVVTSTVHYADDDRWPRRPLLVRAMSVFRGEMTHEQFRRLESTEEA